MVKTRLLVNQEPIEMNFDTSNRKLIIRKKENKQ